MSTKTAVNASTTIANLAIAYHSEQYQQVGKDIEVRYPDSKYVDFQTFLDNKCDIPKEANAKSKIYTLDTEAVKLFNAFSEKVQDIVKDNWDDSFNDFTKAKELSEHAEGSVKALLDFSKANPVDKTFENAVSDTITELEKSLSRYWNNKKQTNKMKPEISKIFAKVIVDIVFAIAEFLAVNAIFNTAKTTTKIAGKDVMVGFMYLAKKSTHLDNVYNFLVEFGTPITSKPVHVTVKTGTSAATKAKAGGKTTKSNVKDSISDGESEEEEAVAKTKSKKTATKKANKKAKEAQESDSEAEDEDKASDVEDDEE